MNILIAGASGFIGDRVRVAAEAAGHRVIPVSRRTGIDYARMQTASDWLSHLDGVDVVINCVGIIGETRRQRFAALHTAAPIALFDACVRAGVPRVIQISALGADESAFSRYHLTKKAADDHLRCLPLHWFVLRPSLIDGPGGASATIFRRLACLPAQLVVDDGLQRIQPVHIDDVVSTVLACITASDTGQTFDIVGGETIPFVEWIQRLRLAQGFPLAPVLQVPVRVARWAVEIGKPFSPLLRAENLHMLLKGYEADGAAWRRFLGRPPRTLGIADLRAELSDDIKLHRNPS